MYREMLRIARHLSPNDRKEVVLKETRDFFREHATLQDAAAISNAIQV